MNVITRWRLLFEESFLMINILLFLCRKKLGGLSLFLSLLRCCLPVQMKEKSVHEDVSVELEIFITCLYQGPERPVDKLHKHAENIFKHLIETVQECLKQISSVFLFCAYLNRPNIWWNSEHVCDMIKTHGQGIIQITSHSTAQSFG